MARRQTKSEMQHERAVAAGPLGGTGPLASPASTNSDPVYPVEVLLENAKAMFGVPPYTIVGAMVNAPTKAAYAVSEVQAYLDSIGSVPIR